MTLPHHKVAQSLHPTRSNYQVKRRILKGIEMVLYGFRGDGFGVWIDTSFPAIFGWGLGMEGGGGRNGIVDVGDA
jgi:hypothetical protein